VSSICATVSNLCDPAQPLRCTPPNLALYHSQLGDVLLTWRCVALGFSIHGFQLKDAKLTLYRFAGSDSTASTMQSFFYHVLKEPEIYSKLVSEILSAPLSQQVQWTEAQQLPYFQACLKEAMRVRPAVGLNITRLIPPGGADVDGTFFPGGTRVAVNGWVLHRDKGIFGEDVEVFRPERWLGDEENAKRMDRYMFQFGGGAHLCIGRNLALLEINKVIPRLIRDFRFDLVDPDQELKANATFFVVQSGLQVFISKRNR
jgi:cytochrome P450